MKKNIFIFLYFYIFIYAQDNIIQDSMISQEQISHHYLHHIQDVIPNDDEEKLNSLLSKLPLSPSKIIYIKDITPKENLNKIIYIGQTIKVSYNLLLLSESKLAKVIFKTPIDTNQIKLLNPDSPWEAQGDGSYKNTFIYKILNKGAKIPQIRAFAISQNEKYQDVALSPKINLDIYNLRSNPNYSGVVANHLQILRTKTKNYDDVSNIMVLELEGNNANLEDFVLPNNKILKQGIQSIEKNQGIYYCILPKNISSLSFDFFSLTNNQFETLTIPIVVSRDNVAAQDDLKPKNIFLLYSTLFLIISIVILLGIFICLWRSKWLLVAIILLVLYLAWHIFYRHHIVLYQNQVIKILPTHNSTTLFIVHTPTEVEVIGSHDGYYKIITQDGRIGWIKKDKK